MIALLCSVTAEADRISGAIQDATTYSVGSTLLIEGSLSGRKIVLCAGGMGKVNAAHAATLLLTRCRPEALLIFGIGGAYPSSGASVGHVAVALREIAGDEGVLTAEGFRDPEFIGIPLLKTASATIFSAYPAPEAMVARARTAFANQGAAVHFGTFVTLSTCTGTDERSRELEERYHGLCENMEGAAAAHVAELHGVPWLELRGISNRVQKRDLSTWDVPAASRAVQQALLGLIEGWE